MTTEPRPIPGWGGILLTLLLTTLAAGMTLGLLGDLSGRNLSGGVGAAVGLVGALLVGRRVAAQNAAKKPT